MFNILIGIIGLGQELEKQARKETDAYIIDPGFGKSGNMTEQCRLK